MYNICDYKCLYTFVMNEVYCRACIFVCYLRDGAKKVTLATKCTVLFLLSSGVALVNL